MGEIIEDEYLKLEISTYGAEIQEIINKKNGKNYLWNGDKEFWGRKSPILFPFVGALKNKEYSYESKKYPMGQHGFARDMEFALLQKTKNSILYELKSNNETLEKYPFEFSLRVGYELNQNKIIVKWEVKNIDNKVIYFSIGGHPAFQVPVSERENCYIKFDNKSDLINTGLENGLANTNNVVNGKISTDNGYLGIDKDLFKYDALIFENNQLKEVSLCMEDKSEYIKVKFDSPLVGIWSPYKENCPFVCIEPWYGRCDGVDFSGELEDRQWQQSLEPEESFKCNYEIEIVK